AAADSRRACCAQLPPRGQNHAPLRVIADLSGDTHELSRKCTSDRGAVGKGAFLGALNSYCNASYCNALTLFQIKTPRNSGLPGVFGSGIHTVVIVNLSPSTLNKRTCSVPVHASFQAISTDVMNRSSSTR